ncbi:phenylalanine--tRNA ligase subunit alpha [bacterium I07]|nr:phenylalanine--tRNA ligase subunit alpha [bacterium I07]
MPVENINPVDEIRARFDKEHLEVKDDPDLERLRITYLGRKGEIAQLFKTLGSLPEEARKSQGQKINELKTYAQGILDNLRVQVSNSVDSNWIDPTLPGPPIPIGRYHPMTQVFREIKSCFLKMGFSIAQGPDVETEYYNFEALNLPSGHPARDMQDTLFVDADDQVLRTHTSPVQVRVMESQPPPVRIIAPGRCYRRDTPDSTHSPIFHQVEGLCVDEGVTFADLKAVILNFARYMLGSDMKIRFRPSYFPFTEPSAEYDFSCFACKGRGCRICKGTGWIEISGAGMVNPAVFNFVGYDSEKYTGFAFGMGVERIAMLLYEVNDIRMFYENDVRFLSQF